jgi:hypothetical protein
MKLSELAAKIIEKEAPPAKEAPPPKPVAKPILTATKKEAKPAALKAGKKGVLKVVGEKVKVEKPAEAAPTPPPPPPPKPIDITGKSTWDLLLELGEVPHYMVMRNPTWDITPEKGLVEEINEMNPVYLLKMSEYYNTLEKMGELTENERLAARAMRDRIWNENIGDAPVDLVPLTQEDREAVERMTITTLSGEEIPATFASNRELAEALYLREQGPLTFGKLGGSLFDDAAEVRSEFIKELQLEFGATAYSAGDPMAPLLKVRTQLPKEALYKRLLLGHSRVPLPVLKERQARAAEWKAAAAAYFPPEYEAVKGYYRPDWKDQDVTYSQQQMIGLAPKDLLSTYKIYYILKSKGELNKHEEYLLDEMERLLNEFQAKGMITVTKPKTTPPVPITQERFVDYLRMVNDLFGSLPEESVVKLSKSSESDVVLKVLRSGVASEDERKVFVKAIDELFEELPETEMDKFSESPKSNLYMRIVDKYVEG